MLNERQKDDLMTTILEAINDYLDQQDVDYFSTGGTDWNQLREQIGETLDRIKYTMGVERKE